METEDYNKFQKSSKIQKHFIITSSLIIIIILILIIIIIFISYHIYLKNENSLSSYQKKMQNAISFKLPAALKQNRMNVKQITNSF